MTYNIKTQSNWYASYMEDYQGKALVLCQKKKIEQLELLIETIKGEIEQYDYAADMRFNSIIMLIDEIEPVEHTSGGFME